VLTRHHAETGSAVAERLLAAGDAGLDRISKVMPRDYKRVLLAQAEAEREGRDVNEAVMASAQS
jgi:glutamate synthase (NADPH) large chain